MLKKQLLGSTWLKINKILSESTGQDIKKIQKDTDRDYWLNAEESVSYGLISRVISKRSDLN